MGQELRRYQQQARERIHAEWENGHTRTLLVLPTGTGKTIVFASVAADQVRAGHRVLILAHRGELLEQAADKLQRSTGLVSAVEKADATCLNTWFRVVVGSVQTLQRTARLERFPHDYFGTIIIDEAHHAITDGYRRILDYFDHAKVLGVTATPDRGDMRNLGEVFDSLAFEYKLTDAIKEGYLCRIMAQTIPLKLDISSVTMSGGDYAVGDLGTALDPYLEQIAAEMAQRCKGRKTVVFLPLIKTSQKFRDLLNAKGFCAAEVNGQSADRREVLADFDAGKYNVLCNSMLLTEGCGMKNIKTVAGIQTSDMKTIGTRTVQKKANGVTQTGTGNVYFGSNGSNLFTDMLLQYINTGVMETFDITITNNDPTASVGDQVMGYYGCMLTGEIPLSILNDDEAMLNYDFNFSYTKVNRLKAFSDPVNLGN